MRTIKQLIWFQRGHHVRQMSRANNLPDFPHVTHDTKIHHMCRMGFRIQLACFLADATFKHIRIFVLSVCLVHKRPARRAQVMCRVPVLVLDPKISMMLDKQLCNVFSFTNSSIVECRLPFIVLNVEETVKFRCRLPKWLKRLADSIWYAELLTAIKCRNEHRQHVYH